MTSQGNSLSYMVLPMKSDAFIKIRLSIIDINIYSYIVLLDCFIKLFNFMKRNTFI